VADVEKAVEQSIAQNEDLGSENGHQRFAVGAM
jgi:hypothetical protein